ELRSKGRGADDMRHLLAEMEKREDKMRVEAEARERHASDLRSLLKRLEVRASAAEDRSKQQGQEIYALQSRLESEGRARVEEDAARDAARDKLQAEAQSAKGEVERLLQEGRVFEEGVASALSEVEDCLVDTLGGLLQPMELAPKMAGNRKREVDRDEDEDLEDLEDLEGHEGREDHEDLEEEDAGTTPATTTTSKPLCVRHERTLGRRITRRRHFPAASALTLTPPGEGGGG
ncbi:unnamed protein product, partial [Discosporangium mesarthrocarpum]